MDINYFKKIQNAYHTSSKREWQLNNINRYADRHFADTVDCEPVEINGIKREMIVIKDTDGNTFKKKIKTRHDEPFNLGDYVIWEDKIWLVMALDPNDKVWHSGYMYLCPILLRFQNPEGNIIERWGYSEDFTKYSTGVSGNENIELGEYQYGITIPVDDNTKYLKRGKRFPIDFEGVYPPDVYKLTNRKIFLNDDRYFGRGGIMTLTLSYDFFNKDSDKEVTLEDGKNVWICDYFSPTPAPGPDVPGDDGITTTISGNPKLRVGFPRTYTVAFTNETGSIVEGVDFSWKIICAFADNVLQKIDGNSVTLQIDDEDYIGSSFLLQVVVDNNVADEIEITVSPLF